MTLAGRVAALATAIGLKIKDLYTNQGSLAALTTTAKGSLVSAINELKAGGSVINDAAASGTTTYSSTKIQAVADASALAVKTQLLGGASAAFDTLSEIEAKLGTDDTSLANLLTAVGTRVRFDAAQTLTAGQMTQACANIGIGEPDTDFVSTFNAALV